MSKAPISILASRNNLPRLPYEAMKRAILGKRYELSYSAVTSTKARALNKKYRKRSYVPDVLSFPLSKTEGEIVMNVGALTAGAKERAMPLKAFAAYMFIHSCLHLKGHKHGSAMTAQEAILLKKFGLSDMAAVL